MVVYVQGCQFDSPVFNSEYNITVYEKTNLYTCDPDATGRSFSDRLSLIIFSRYTYDL